VGLRRVDGEAAIAVLMSASYAPETQWEVAAAVLAQEHLVHLAHVGR
jgi:hypothetical protein